MKLVELLARELKEWPEAQQYAWQDHDAEIRFSDTTEDDFFVSTMCVDHTRMPGQNTPKDGVNRYQWEAERAKLHTTDEPSAPTTSGEYEQQISRTDRMQAGGPIQWRDRIHAIDAEIHELNAAHTAAVEAREEERIALVQRLELEGLQLIAAKAQPAEDESDWSTWKAGDILECLEDHTPGWQFTKGKLYTLGEDVTRTEVAHVVKDDAGDENGWGCSNFKLHARAAK